MSIDLRDSAPGLASLVVLPLVVVTRRGPLLFRSPGSLEINAAARLPRWCGPVFDSEGRVLALDGMGRSRRRARGRSSSPPALPELRVVDPRPAHRYRLRLELERALGLEAHSGEDLFDLVVSAIARFGLV